MRDPLWPGRLADMFDTAHSISRPLIGITSSMNTAMFIACGSGMPTRPALCTAPRWPRAAAELAVV